VLTLLSRHQLALDHFREEPGGAVYLNDRGWKVVLAAHRQRKQQEEVHHPLLKQRIPWERVPHAQARLLARHLRTIWIATFPPLLGKGRRSVGWPSGEEGKTSPAGGLRRQHPRQGLVVGASERLLRSAAPTGSGCRGRRSSAWRSAVGRPRRQALQRLIRATEDWSELADNVGEQLGR
jgi:hypothetical protein